MFDIESIFENLPDLLPRDPASVIRRYVDSHDEEVEDYEDLLEVVKRSHQIDKAQGGTKAEGTVQFTVKEDATGTIEEGTVVGTQPDSNGNFLKFTTTESVDVGSSAATYWGNDWNSMNWALAPSQNTITVDAEIVAEETGTQYNVAANTITYMPDPPPGVVSITNQKQTTGGIITDLDQIGAMFGPLGQREERGDPQYRAYLKSLVPAFKGRGTIPSIKSVIAAGLAVDDSDVSINEHFQDLEYTVILKDWEAHEVSTVEELADLSDASVSRLRKTSYREDDEMGVTDDVSVTEGIQISESASVSDTANVNQNKVITAEQTGASEAVGVDVNNPTVNEGAGVDDAVATDTAKVHWNDGSWETMNWAIEQ